MEKSFMFHDLNNACSYMKLIAQLKNVSSQNKTN